MYKRQIYTKANKEIAVASTKSFTGQVVSLTLLALLLAPTKGKLTTGQIRMLLRELGDTAEQIQHILDTQRAAGHEAALACREARSALFVGRGMGSAISCESLNPPQLPWKGYPDPYHIYPSVPR